MFRYLFAGLSLVVATAAGLAWWQWVDPTKAPVIYSFSETYYARSVAANAPQDKINWAKLAVKSAPARSENWMLVATAYQAADGQISARTLDAVRQSYAVGPLSRDVHDWRLTYVFSQWPQMPRDLQTEAVREAKIYATRNVGMKFLMDLARTLSDPQARLTVRAITLAERSKQRAARNADPQRTTVNR